MHSSSLLLPVLTVPKHVLEVCHDNSGKRGMLFLSPRGLTDKIKRISWGTGDELKHLGQNELFTSLQSTTPTRSLDLQPSPPHPTLPHLASSHQPAHFTSPHLTTPTRPPYLTPPSPPYPTPLHPHPIPFEIQAMRMLVQSMRPFATEAPRGLPHDAGLGRNDGFYAVYGAAFACEMVGGSTGK